MPVKKLKSFLDGHHIKYVAIKHSPAYTALEIAHLAHIPDKEWAKTVMVLIDNKLAMVVMPAHSKLNLGAFQSDIGAGQVVLATEDDFQGKFPECDLGAMPPFGNLYDIDMYLDERLSENKEIAFNAGTHSELIKLDYNDYLGLAEPTKVMKLSH